MSIQFEDLDIESICELLISYKIHPIVANRFREQMIDGYILSRMQTIPVSLLPETGNQIKFCQFYHDFTGKDLDYPPNYQTQQYQQMEQDEFVEANESENGVDNSLIDNLNQISQQQEHLQQQQQRVQPTTTTTNLQMQMIREIENRLVRQDQLEQQQQRQRLHQQQHLPAVNGQKIALNYPTPLPRFSDMVENQLKSDNCLRIVYLMNRELVDFYNNNNYELNALDACKNVAKTVLDNYPVLKEAVTSLVNIENRIRNRRRLSEPWSYLSKKLSTRRYYVRVKAERDAYRRNNGLNGQRYTNNQVLFNNLAQRTLIQPQMAVEQQNEATVNVHESEDVENLNALVEAAAEASKELEEAAVVHDDNVGELVEVNTEPAVETVGVVDENNNYIEETSDHRVLVETQNVIVNDQNINDKLDARNDHIELVENDESDKENQFFNDENEALRFIQKRIQLQQIELEEAQLVETTSINDAVENVQYNDSINKESQTISELNTQNADLETFNPTIPLSKSTIEQLDNFELPTEEFNSVKQQEI